MNNRRVDEYYVCKMWDKNQFGRHFTCEIYIYIYTWFNVGFACNEITNKGKIIFVKALVT